MSLLKFKAKVKMVSEEDMELEEMDMGIIAKSKEWMWRAVAVQVEEIYKVIAYTSTKSIVQMYDGEKILVAESFEELCDRWERAVIEMRLSEGDWPVYNETDESFDTDGEP
jgi:hypothetical protein